MWRPLLRAARFSRQPKILAARRSVGTQSQPWTIYLPPVRVLGPTLWSLAAVGTIYLGCAAYEVHQDEQRRKRPESRIRALYPQHDRQQQPQFDIAAPPRTWNKHSGADQVILGTIGVNTALFAAYGAVPGILGNMVHRPTAARNSTLFTSMFAHTGFLHLAFNMYAMFSFGPAVARSPTFANSGSHLAAFYLSTGVLASLTQHLTCIWPKPLNRLTPFLGASGAVFGMLGVYGITNPDGRIGIMFIPGSLPARDFLGCWALVELYGLFIGIPRLRLGHGAHLSGLATGVAYVYFDGKDKVWKPAKRLASNVMRRLNVI